MYNRVILIGRLTRDPELRYTANGSAVASFALAVDRNFKNANGERETDFINIVAWRNLGERCSEYLSKGKLAAVEGRLQIRSYEGQDGIKRTVAEVVADDVRFLSPRDNNSGMSGGNAGNFGGGMDDFGVGSMPSTDDDVPF